MYMSFGHNYGSRAENVAKTGSFDAFAIKNVVLENVWYTFEKWTIKLKFGEHVW